MVQFEEALVTASRPSGITHSYENVISGGLIIFFLGGLSLLASGGMWCLGMGYAFLGRENNKNGGIPAGVASNAMRQCHVFLLFLLCLFSTTQLGGYGPELDTFYYFIPVTFFFGIISVVLGALANNDPPPAAKVAMYLTGVASTIMFLGFYINAFTYNTLSRQYVGLDEVGMFTSPNYAFHIPAGYGTNAIAGYGVPTLSKVTVYSYYKMLDQDGSTNGKKINSKMHENTIAYDNDLGLSETSTISWLAAVPGNSNNKWLFLKTTDVSTIKAYVFVYWDIASNSRANPFIITFSGADELFPKTFVSSDNGYGYVLGKVDSSVSVYKIDIHGTKTSGLIHKVNSTNDRNVTVTSVGTLPEANYKIPNVCGDTKPVPKTVIHEQFIVAYLPCSTETESAVGVYDIVQEAWQSELSTVLHNDLHSWNGVVTYAPPAFVLIGGSVFLFGANNRPYHALGFRLKDKDSGLGLEQFVMFTSGIPSGPTAMQLQSPHVVSAANGSAGSLTLFGGFNVKDGVYSNYASTIDLCKAPSDHLMFFVEKKHCKNLEKNQVPQISFRGDHTYFTGQAKVVGKIGSKTCSDESKVKTDKTCGGISSGGSASENEYSIYIGGVLYGIITHTSVFVGMLYCNVLLLPFIFDSCTATFCAGLACLSKMLTHTFCAGLACLFKMLACVISSPKHIIEYGHKKNRERRDQQRQKQLDRKRKEAEAKEQKRLAMKKRKQQQAIEERQSRVDAIKLSLDKFGLGRLAEWFHDFGCEEASEFKLVETHEFEDNFNPNLLERARFKKVQSASDAVLNGISSLEDAAEKIFGGSSLEKWLGNNGGKQEHVDWLLSHDVLFLYDVKCEFGTVEALVDGDEKMPTIKKRKLKSLLELARDAHVAVETRIEMKQSHEGGAPSRYVVKEDQLGTKMVALFDEFDVDLNGMLDKQELSTMLISKGFPPEAITAKLESLKMESKKGIGIEVFKAEFKDMFVKHEEDNKRMTRGGNSTIQRSNSVTNSVKVLSDLFPEENRVAVIFACNDYKTSLFKGKPLKDLNAAVKDAEMFRTTIEKMGFKVICFKTNEECTKKNVEEALCDVQDKFGNMSDKGQLAQFVFYYAGHGVETNGGRGGILALHGFQENKSRTQLNMSVLKAQSKEIGATQQMWFLDCCHAGHLFGSGTRGSNVDFGIHLASQPCVFGITAVTGDQEAIEDGGNGLFTKTLCQALETKIGRPDDPYFTGESLREFITQRVYEYSEQRMQPLGGSLLLDHKNKPCTGQFVVFDPADMNKAQ